MNENTFVAQLEALLKKDGFLTQRELGVGYGIADLVVIDRNGINDENCKLRKSHGQIKPLLGEEYFKTLKVLPDEHNQEKAVDFNFIAKKSSLSNSYLKYKILKDLEENGYIKTVGKNHYFKVNGWLPVANELVAIEAKLKDWKRGAIQANRYKAFASKVYLAVPEQTIHLVDKKFLMKHNIGLISLNIQSKQRSTILECASEKPFDEFKSSYAAEFFWSKKQLVKFA